MIHKILVATDFADASAAALELAAELARRFGATLTLFHAHQVPAYLQPDALVDIPATLLDELERSNVAELERMAARTTASSGVPIEIRHAIGPPADEICRAAEALGADLVVLGTHGRSGLRHLILGSVADRVVRKARAPVLTVHPKLVEAHPS
jgi:nucleotide-binding universal stress UspA family protein